MPLYIWQYAFLEYNIWSLEQTLEPKPVRIADRELMTVEVLQTARVRGKREFQLVRAKRLKFRVIPFVERVLAVLAVAEQRMSDMREVSAYLVSSSREQIDLDQRKLSPALQNPILRLYCKMIGARLVRNKHLILLGELFQIRREHRRTRLGSSSYGA